VRKPWGPAKMPTAGPERGPMEYSGAVAGGVLVPSGGNGAGGSLLTLKGAVPAQSARLRQCKVAAAIAT
jgi:hypothetical protein